MKALEYIMKLQFSDQKLDHSTENPPNFYLYMDANRKVNISSALHDLPHGEIQFQLLAL